MGVFARNGDGDEVRFVHEGEGTLQTDYGDRRLPQRRLSRDPARHDVSVSPRNPNTHLVIESATEIGLPDRGMLGRHAQFDPMIMRTPEIPAAERKDGANSAGEFELHIKREGSFTKVFYPWNPMNAAGWKGDLSPWALNVDDIRPIVSPRYHLPPSVHTTFLARNFVICSFLPRPLESEAGAMKVPFYHRNIDFDEVLFYHAGNFFSREGIARWRGHVPSAGDPSRPASERGEKRRGQDSHRRNRRDGGYVSSASSDCRRRRRGVQGIPHESGKRIRNAELRS